MTFYSDIKIKVRKVFLNILTSWYTRKVIILTHGVNGRGGESCTRLPQLKWTSPHALAIPDLSKPPRELTLFHRTPAGKFWYRFEFRNLVPLLPALSSFSSLTLSFLIRILGIIIKPTPLGCWKDKIISTPFTFFCHVMKMYDQGSSALHETS